MPDLEKVLPDLTIKDGQWCEATESDSVYRYRTELAKSGRSKCSKCCEKIEKDTIRLGIPTRWKHWFNSWCHYSCLRIKGTKEEISESIFAFDELSKKHKSELLAEVMKTDIPEKLKPNLDDTWRPSKSADDIDPITTLSLPLLPFQQVGVAWMMNQEVSDVKGGILSDEMGMGKTIQTIALIVATNNQTRSKNPTLIVCPSSALGQWTEEIKKFAPSLTTMQINHLSDIGSTPSSRKSLLSFDVVLTSYSIAEHSYRRVVNQTKVSCKYCKKKYLPDTLVTHQQYFCGPKAVRTKKLALREKKTKVAAEKAKATLGITSTVPSMTNIYKEIMYDAGKEPIGRYDKGERAIKKEQEEEKENLVIKPIGMARQLVPKADLPTMTVKKLTLVVQDRYGFEPSKQRLIFNSKLVEQDNKKLSTLGITAGCIIHVAFDLSKDEESDKEREDSSDIRKQRVKRKPSNIRKGKKTAVMSDSDSSDSSSEEMAKPRPKRNGQLKKDLSTDDSSESSRRRKVPSAKKSARKPSKKKTLKKSAVSSDSDSSSSSSSVPVNKKPTRKQAKKPARKVSKRATSSDSESSDSSSSSPVKKPTRKQSKKPAKKVTKKPTFSDSDSSDSSSVPMKGGRKAGKKPSKKLSRRKAVTSSDSECSTSTSSSYVSLPTSAYMSSTSASSSSSDSDSKPSDSSSDSESLAPAKQPVKKHKLDLADSFLHSVNWRRLVIDEAHRIKGKTSSTAKSIFAIESTYRWGLTGTPLQNRVSELGSLVRYLRFDPYAFYGCNAKGCDCKSLDWNFGWKQTKCPQCDHASFKHFSNFNKHVLTPIRRYGCIGDGLTAFNTLRSKILEKMQLRRTKVEVSAQIKLPEMNIIVHRGTLDERELDFYEALYKKSTAKFDAYVEQDSLLHNYAHIFELLARLRQAVDHPLLVTSKDVVTKSKPPATCGICGDTIDVAGADKKTHVKAVPCKHLFHGKCASLYLEMSTNEKVPCPAFCCDKELHQDEFCNVEDDKNDEDSAGSSDGEDSDSDQGIMSSVSKSNFTSSTKVEDLLKYVKAIPAGEKCVIFSQYSGMLDIIKWRLSKERISILKLTGSMSIDSRTSVLAKFKTDPSVKGLLLSLRAGGEGLNLQVANHVFAVDPWWNPAIEMQAIQRVHRIGQTKPVTAVRFVTTNTIEERMYELQQKKQLVFDGTIEGSSAALAKLNGDDISFLFNH
eukprot:TRINITY_DN1292_c0_g1_i3.p1 TRINITY_DN1292_c0_g1~~TRINITY_DN1292_c0_g1_i3.p1  ORF type:complete len:1205 (+),score=247.80 TRINITY_DN1292_c0_g1_i3:162-3776(+)